MHPGLCKAGGGAQSDRPTSSLTVTPCDDPRRPDSLGTVHVIIRPADAPFTHPYCRREPVCLDDPRLAGRFWGSELTHAWYEFTEVGYDTVIASPKGGKVELDALSDPRDPRDPNGYSAEDVITMGFLNSPKLVALLDNTPAVTALSAEDFAALYVAGGQSPMFTFRQEKPLHTLINAFYQAGKPRRSSATGLQPSSTSSSRTVPT